MMHVDFKPNEEKLVAINEHDYAILQEALSYLVLSYDALKRNSPDEMSKLDCQEKVSFAGNVQMKLWQQAKTPSK